MKGAVQRIVHGKLMIEVNVESRDNTGDRRAKGLAYGAVGLLVIILRCVSLNIKQRLL